MKSTFMEQLETRDGFMVPKTDRVCFPAVVKTLPDLQQAIDLCPKRRVAVQAGGNVGVWPVRLACHFDVVHSFEPDPLNFRCLVMNAPLNVICQQAALVARPSMGCIGLSYEEGNIGATETSYALPIRTIPTITIDSLSLDYCDLIYLDIEGDEAGAFEGAVKTIRRHQPVIGFEDKGVKGSMPGALVERLARDFGYKVAARPNRDVIMVPVA
jgi:FkbM family methyltransferase